MIDGITFQANIHVCKVKGCQYMDLYDPSGRGVSPPLSDERMYLKNDVTKKWLFCLIKGVFETELLR